jgi:hypothetical protein
MRLWLSRMSAVSSGGFKAIWLEELYPEYFSQGAEPQEARRPEGWSEYDGWCAIESGGKW